ncbi:Pre-mRNA-splicing factor PRP46 [Astathelohania contejeani]|uniref:Pre-mRNA-splicing factor PRP46 n=1 Tax=Astathelohania contejeani TaxID=164912 RepID=A0ABQ7I0F2_9MICR|nr:Pre-mRNA-splicing factor PRP46 [Thelohania contejeani]
MDHFIPSKIIIMHSGPVTSLSVDSTNKILASSSVDTTIKLVSMSTYTQLLTLTGHILPVHDIRFVPDQPLLLSCSSDKLVKCFDLTSNKHVRDFRGHSSGVSTVDSNGNIIASGSLDRTIRIWDQRSRKTLAILSGHVGSITRVRFRNEEVISCSDDQTVRIWDFRMMTQRVLTEHKKPVRDIGIFHNNIVSISNDIIHYTIKGEDIKSNILNTENKIIEDKYSENNINKNKIIDDVYKSLCFNSDGICYIANNKGEIFSYNMETTNINGRINCGKEINKILIDISEKRMFIGCDDNTIMVYNKSI